MLLAIDGELRTKWLGFEPRLLRPTISQIDKTVTLLHKFSLHTKLQKRLGMSLVNISEAIFCFAFAPAKL